MIIVINGQAASGKGTLCQLLSHELGFIHYDFGLIFRAIVYLFINGYTWEDIKNEIVSRRLYYSNRFITFQGRDITKILFSEEVGLETAKIVSKNEVVVELSKMFVNNVDFIADGRTISKIYPNADFHFYVVVDKKEAKERRRLQGENVKNFDLRCEIDEKRIWFHKDTIFVETTNKTPKKSLEDILSYLSRQDH